MLHNNFVAFVELFVKIILRYNFFRTHEIILISCYPLLMQKALVISICI